MTKKIKPGPSENHINTYTLLKNYYFPRKVGKAYSNKVFTITLGVREIYMSKVKCYSFEKAFHYSRYLPNKENGKNEGEV